MNKFFRKAQSQHLITRIIHIAVVLALVAGSVLAAAATVYGQAVGPSFILGAGDHITSTQIRTAQSNWQRALVNVDWNILEPNGPTPFESYTIDAKNHIIKAYNAIDDVIANGLTPIIIFNGSPSWARKPSDVDITDTKHICQPILSTRYAEFATIIQRVISGYRSTHDNTKASIYLEIYNEPDAGYNPGSSYIGCWAFRGNEYGKMLTSVYDKLRNPSSSTYDSNSYIVLGGLLMGCGIEGGSCPSADGNFFRDALQGMTDLNKPGFDIVAYHAYPIYCDSNSRLSCTNTAPDPDRLANGWVDNYGILLGKYYSLRDTMSKFGDRFANKPIMMNEGGLLCWDAQFGTNGNCTGWTVPGDDHTPAFEYEKANYAIRSYARSMFAGLKAFLWFNNTGWNHAGFVDNFSSNTLPSYTAVQGLGVRLKGYVLASSTPLLPQPYIAATQAPSPQPYINDIEDYRFCKPGSNHEIRIVCTATSTPSAVPTETNITAVYDMLWRPIAYVGTSTIGISYRPTIIERETTGACPAYWNFNASNNYAPYGNDSVSSVPRYLSGPCAAKPDTHACQFDTLTLYISGNRTVESITAYGKRWDFWADTYTPLNLNGTDLTSEARYQSGPCQTATTGFLRRPGTPCVFDTRIISAIAPGGRLIESITAYGKYWNFWVDTLAPFPDNGGDLSSVQRYSQGPCADVVAGSYPGKQSGAPCVFDTRTIFALNGRLVESITAYGKYWNFWADTLEAFPDNGSDLTSIARYKNGPCAGVGLGMCRFATRTVYMFNGQLIESILGSGGSPKPNNPPSTASFTTFAAYATNQGVSLNWTVQEYKTARFEVYRSNQSGTACDRSVAVLANSSQITSDISVGVNSYQWLDVPPSNNPYCYWVRAIATDGSTQETGPVSSLSFITPTPPILNSATPSNGRVTLNWGAVSRATNYTVKYGTSPGLYGVTLANIGNVTGYDVAGLTNGTTYYFVVTASSTANVPESANSNEKNATPQPPLPPPPAPTLNSATAGNAKVTLNWSAATGATGYTVKYGTSAGSYPIPLNVGNITTFDVTGLTNNTAYYFVVAAINSAGSSINSNAQTATPQPPPPGVPTLNTVVPGNAKVTLNWAAAAGATGYSVRYGTSAGNYLNSVPVGNVVNYDVTGLTNGVTYYFVVAASNTGGSSTNSNVLSAIPQPPAPGVPTLNSATPGDAKVSLSWTGVSGATSYSVKFGTAPGNYLNTVSAGTATSLDVTGLTKGTDYYLDV